MAIDLGLLTHLFNFVLLSAAVVMALRMTRESDFALAWVILAAAFILTAVSPLLDLYGHLYQQNHTVILESSDVLAAISALLMLVGVFLLRRIVAGRRETQQRLHQQIDELQRFHKLAVGRELRMKELVEENETLRNQAGLANKHEVKP